MMMMMMIMSGGCAAHARGAGCGDAGVGRVGLSECAWTLLATQDNKQAESQTARAAFDWWPMRGGTSLKQTRRRHLQVIAAAAVMPALPRVSYAQSWPAKPIRVIIPFSAGSTIDIVARIVFEPLGRQLGQALVIENRGGAGGTVGAAAVARAEPDGYTLMAHSSAHVTTPAIYPNAPYDTAKDFAAVAAFGSSPNVTVVAPEKGIKTLQQLVAAAKAKPGSITF